MKYFWVVFVLIVSCQSERKPDIKDPVLQECIEFATVSGTYDSSALSDCVSFKRDDLLDLLRRQNDLLNERTSELDAAKSTINHFIRSGWIDPNDFEYVMSACIRYCVENHGLTDYCRDECSVKVKGVTK